MTQWCRASGCSLRGLNGIQCTMEPSTHQCKLPHSLLQDPLVALFSAEERIGGLDPVNYS